MKVFDIRSGTFKLKEKKPLDGKDGESIVGPIGHQGIPGIQGIQGLKGDQGSKGQRGPKGLKGDIGPQGIPGKNGLDGKDGLSIEGPQGIPGKNGSFIHISTFKPSDSLGNENDWCFTHLGEVFYKKENKWNFYRSFGGGSSSRIRKLQEIGNVRISNLQPNDVLMWNGVFWENSQVAGTSSDYKQYVDVVSDSITYIGLAEAGSSVSSAVWKIKKLITTGQDLEIIWADGNTNFDNVWNDRESLIYS